MSKPSTTSRAEKLKTRTSKTKLKEKKNGKPYRDCCFRYYFRGPECQRRPPPDPVFTLDGTSGFAHPRSPTGFNAQPSYKKGRGVDGSCDSQKDLDVMMRDDSSDTIVELDNSDPSLALSPTAKAADGGIFSPGVPSFKEKLMGATGCIRDTVNLSVLDVDVRDEDDVDHVEVGRIHASTSEPLLPMHTLNNERPPYFKSDRQGPTNTETHQRQDTVIREQRFEGLSSAEGNRGSVSSRGVPEFDGGHTVPENVASAGRVIAAKSSLTAAKNVAVQVLEPGMALGSHAPKGRILPNSLRSADDWNCRFAILCWLLWKDRCDNIFSSVDSNREGLLIRGNRLLDECVRAFETRSRSQPTILAHQRWSKPPLGWVKANVDASVEIEGGKATVGGVFRDELGYWLGGFTRNIGRCSAFLAELWAVHDCLSRACLNRLADRLAALGRLSSREGITLPVPPTDLVSLVEEESESADPALLVAHNWGSAESVHLVSRTSSVHPWYFIVHDDIKAFVRGALSWLSSIHSMEFNVEFLAGQIKDQLLWV
ncbi:hypothetical protein V6N12_048738 [Hibiscus sabdariffa]|uniref:RNase H type-1 domain-containing protein n=1 Tax=Hibiscus sabdariffa TaxID=183260 RepID=A0ABR2EI55_9ROSI